jgi:hypothetical protein
MKILLTGMASSHTSPKANKKNKNFFGTLNDALLTLKHEVVWQPASVLWTKEYLEQFDAIFVGIVPPTSVSANKAYGALSVLELMFSSPKLKLVVDSPQQWQIEPSLNSVVNNPESLVKPFYSKRSEYLEARSKAVLERLVAACRLLLTESWPITLYPGLPWKDDESVASNLPSGAASSLLGFNFDRYYSHTNPINEAKNEDSAWVSTNLTSKWSEKVAETVKHPIKPLREKKSDTDEEALYNIHHSIGLLLSPQERSGGTWWSYSLVQALSNLTPVATEWRESAEISPRWALLPYQIEEMTAQERYMHALEQRQTYLDAIPEIEESLTVLKNLLKNN